MDRCQSARLTHLQGAGCNWSQCRGEQEKGVSPRGWMNTLGICHCQSSQAGDRAVV